MIKKCKGCGLEKPVSDFHKKKNGLFGVKAQCRVCCANWQHSGGLLVPPPRGVLAWRSCYRSFRGVDVHPVMPTSWRMPPNTDVLAVSGFTGTVLDQPAAPSSP